MNDAESQKRGAAEVAGAIRQRIRRGELDAYERLPAERELARAHGVARGTVRVALAQLADEGLVESRAGSGTYVRPAGGAEQSANKVIADTRPLELIDARFALEPQICRLAVLHGTMNDFARAEPLLARMEACVQDPVAFAMADTQFHILLAELTGNPLLGWIMRQISEVRDQNQWAKMRQLTLDEATITLYNQQHRDLIETLRRRDPDGAAQRMHEHLETARRSLTRAAYA